MEDINNALIILAVGIVLVWAIARKISYKYTLALLGLSLTITAYFILARQEFPATDDKQFDVMKHDFYTILSVLWSLFIGALTFARYRTDAKRQSDDKPTGSSTGA